jgi:hypothetical protein
MQSIFSKIEQAMIFIPKDVLAKSHDHTVKNGFFIKVQKWVIKRTSKSASRRCTGGDSIFRIN